MGKKGTDKIRAIIKNNTKKVLPLIRDYLFNKKVLDVGCGTGLEAKFIRDKISYKPFLIDIQDVRDNLSKKFPFLKSSAKNLPFKNSSFDVILMQFVLHHLNASPHIILSELNRVTKKYLIVIEEIFTGGTNLNKVKRYDKKINRILHPKSKYFFKKFYTEKELDKLFKKSNFIVKQKFTLQNPKYLPVNIYILKKIS